MMQRRGVDSDDEDGDIPTVDAEWVVSEEDEEADGEESGEESDRDDDSQSAISFVFSTSTEVRLYVRYR